MYLIQGSFHEYYTKELIPNFFFFFFLKLSEREVIYGFTTNELPFDLHFYPLGRIDEIMTRMVNRMIYQINNAILKVILQAYI